jgi:hypothetical protein
LPTADGATPSQTATVSSVMTQQYGVVSEEKSDTSESGSSVSSSSGGGLLAGLRGRRRVR